jgi:transcription elongation GreA/GreB family factor/very-short-patch-repair endonuclease
MPTLQRMLIAPDRLEEADLNLATKALEEAGKLNQADTPHPDIQRHVHALQDLAAEIRQVCAFFAEVARRLGVEGTRTRQGLAALWAAMNAARAAPLDLLPYRRPQLAEPTAAMMLEKAAQQAATLRNRREAVEALFDTSLLPPRDELATALRAMRTSAGLLRTLRPEWRKAARTYRSIRLVRSWVLRAAQCEVELHSLVTYLDDKALFDGDGELQELLGELFQGIDTDFALVSRLADWYAHARKAFERVGGSVDFTLFLGLPADIIKWLAGRAQEGERYWQVAETLPERVRAALKDTGVPLTFSSNEPIFTDLTEVLEIAAGTLKEISSVLGSYLAVSASPRELVALVEEALSVTVMRREIEHAEVARALLGERFQGLETDFAPIHAVINWSQAIRCAGLPVQIEAWLLRPVPGSLLALRSALEAIEAKWRAVDAATLEFDRFGILNREAWQRGYSEDATGIGERTRRALADSDGLWTWAAFSRALRRTEEIGLSMLTTPVLNGRLAGSEVGSAFGFLFFNSIARAILRENPTLIEFSGLSHEQLRQAFSALDKEVINVNGRHCANAIDLARTAPKGHRSGSPRSYTEMALITREVQKKKGHIPIRQLVNRAGEALQALKPCFMMSPLSVAQYLEPGKLHFDMIIMDEASQIRPEEAIGALARGGQMVIVGDPKQLPPTSFFGRIWGAADEEEEAEETAAEGMQSVLDLCLARYHPPRQLCWHYRSQHEALIHFSNRHFYKDGLIVFPSPYGVQTGLGLRHHYVSKGLYENRRNLEEARRVADAVIYHFLNHLGESLGVATLNLPQRDLIEEEIDRRLRVNPQAEKYIEKWKNEGLMPFFVKNLENVQGDERDVIFISTTYGRSRAGVVAQRFGPINQPDGWRRLNVLFTRARKRVELFTSMQPSDIVVDAKSSDGVRALRDYLAYVRDGILEGPKEGGREPDSDFEIAVAEILQNAGYEVVPQLGVAGFFIDIAVKNPVRPGEYIAAIECDGATYHSARSVRERDRIRQEILEGLGWKDRIYRIWSTDWFRDPNAQIKRLLAFVESARERAEAKAAPQVERQPIEMLQLPFPEETPGAETFCVKVGDWVTYYDPKYPSDKKRVRIVNGASDPSRNFVGSQTPLAKAMLGAGIGDESELMVEGQSARTLKILDID